MPGFILYWRDSFTEKPSPLTYSNKKTLLFLYLAASAEFTGPERGTLQTNINHLSIVVGESYFTTRNWLLQLQSDALITFQRCFKNLLKITIRNYDELSGISKDALKMIQKPFKDASQLPSDFDELQRPKELNNKKINNKEEEGVRKRTTASKKISRDQLQSMLNTDIIPFAETIGLDEETVHEELDKWDEWVDSKGKRISDNKRAFKNWLRNAVKFRQRYEDDVVDISKLRRLN